MRVRDLAGNFAFWAPYAFGSDPSQPQWVLAAEEGVWFNPKYGDFPVTLDVLRSMYENFKTNYPPKPQQLPVDYEHLSVKPDRKPGDGIAAGWILDAELRADGRELWLQIEWTDPAKERLAKKEYKGFSPYFTPNHSTHGKKDLGPTLLGGALTNYQTIPNSVVTCSLDDTIASRRPPMTSTYEGPTMKLKNDKGEDVEIPVASLAGLTLDTLAGIPVVKDLQAKIPAETEKVVKAKEFDTLTESVKTLSTTVEALKTESAGFKTAADTANAKLLDQDLIALEREGRLLPSEKESMKKLALSNRPLFDEMVTARKAGAPLVKVLTSHGADGLPQSGSAVVQFDTIVDQIKAGNTKLTYAEAITLAAAKNPELARQRNIELSVPVGPGGVAMARA